MCFVINNLLQKTIICVIIIYFSIIYSVNCQETIVVNEGEYKAFNGNVYASYFTVTDNCVIYISKDNISDDQLNDSATLVKIFSRVDALYSFFINNLGYEPPGGNVLYGNKVNVFFGPPSCGAGCGLVGSKGVELSGFNHIFYNIKHSLNVNADVIVAYEMGRNFFTFGGKVQFPFDSNDPGAKNGGFAEAFANIMVLYAFDEAMKDLTARHLNETLINKQRYLNKYYAYINDLDATPYNSWARWQKTGLLDPSRVGVAGIDGAAYHSSCVLIGIIETLGKEKVFPDFFKHLREMHDSNSIEDSLSNIAYSFSLATNSNLTSYFENVLKFKITPSIKNKISVLPELENKLLHDKDRLWIIDENQKVPFRVRTLNYLADNATYVIYVNGIEYNSNKDGNFELSIDFLGGDKKRTIRASAFSSNGKIIGSYETKLERRTNVSILNLKENIYAYYVANKTTLNYIDDQFVLHQVNVDENFAEDHGLLWVDWAFSQNRSYNLKGKIKNEYIEGASTLGLSTPARSSGSIPIKGINSEAEDGFFEVVFSDNTSLFFERDELKYVWGRIAFNSAGSVEHAYFKDVIFTDITDNNNNGIPDLDENYAIDSDNDGLDDYIDVQPNIYNGVDPKITKQPKDLTVSLGETVVLRVEAVGTGPMYYRWKKNNYFIGAASTNNELNLESVKELDAGNYSVIVSNSVGEVLSNLININIININVISRALVLESKNDGYARLVQDVSIDSGEYLLVLVTNISYDPDKDNLPNFFRVEPSTAPHPTKTPWKTKKINSGLFEHQRYLSFKSKLSGTIVFSALNNLPIEFRKISLTNSQGKEIINNPEFKENNAWKSEGGKISYKTIENKTLKFTKINRNKDKLDITLEGNIGSIIDIQYSDDLIHWNKYKTVELNDHKLVISVPKNANYNKFYRAALK